MINETNNTSNEGNITVNDDDSDDDDNDHQDYDYDDDENQENKHNNNEFNNYNENWENIRIGDHILIISKEKLISKNNYWVPEMDETIQRIGLVISKDKGSQTILLRTFEPKLGINRDFWYNIEVLESLKNKRDRINNRLPMESLWSIPIEKLKHMTSQIEDSLSIHYARNSLFYLLGYFVKYFPNKISINLFDNQNSLIDLHKVLTLLQEENSFLSFNMKKMAKENYEKLLKIFLQKSLSKSEEKNLALLIKKECMIQLNDLKNKKLPVYTYQSKHPLKLKSKLQMKYKSKSKPKSKSKSKSKNLITQYIFIPNAKKLQIFFDRQTQLKDENEVLYLYKDLNQNQLISFHVGSISNSFKPIKINGNHFWLKVKRTDHPIFTDFKIPYDDGKLNNKNMYSWGYRFYVMPYKMNLIDENVFQFSCDEHILSLLKWIFKISPNLLQQFYCNDIFQALLRILQKRKFYLNMRKIIFRLLSKILLFQINRYTLSRNDPFNKDFNKDDLFHNFNIENKEIGNLKSEMTKLFIEENKRSNFLFNIKSHSNYCKKIIEFLTLTAIWSELLEKNEQFSSSKSLMPLSSSFSSSNKNGLLGNNNINQMGINLGTINKNNNSMDNNLQKNLIKKNPIWFQKFVFFINLLVEIRSDNGYLPNTLIEDAITNSNYSIKKFNYILKHNNNSQNFTNFKEILQLKQYFQKHYLTNDDRNSNIDIFNYLFTFDTKIKQNNLQQEINFYLILRNLNMKKEVNNNNKYKHNNTYNNERINNNNILKNPKRKMQKTLIKEKQKTKTDNQINEKKLLSKNSEKIIQLAFHENLNYWNPKLDRKLILFINQLLERNSTNNQILLTNLNIKQLIHSNKKIYKKSIFNNIDLEIIKRRFMILRYFNQLIIKFISIIDLNLIEKLQYKNDTLNSFLFISCYFSDLRELIFYNVKKMLIDESLFITTLPYKIPIIINPYSELLNIKPELLRNNLYSWEIRKFDKNKKKYIIKNKLYNNLNINFEYMIQKKRNLFIHSLKDLLKKILSQVCYKLENNMLVLNPTLINNPKFRLLGRLLGMAIRTNININVNFPQLIWKLLIMISPTKRDLYKIDKKLFQIIENFDHNSQKFIIHSINNQTVELLFNGKQIIVGNERKKEFIKLAINYRLNEYNNQINLLKRGLKDIVPEYHLFYLFTWEEFKKTVCENLK
ncbi:e3 ubiquitin-protein ligase hectd3 [Anaeramoeba flamelloides]|uniref:E3 ubiquitin-protein ligase hectd3 n=1 Tax=Anaeramoeba flamelloides TaxID=1746091 RepID=A0AAV7Z043_9EUKA|nr:e3 ubiquitin-protein ligase hectd3 [Anaeramoeba flamelloides]